MATCKHNIFLEDQSTIELSMEVYTYDRGDEHKTTAYTLIMLQPCVFHTTNEGKDGRIVRAQMLIPVSPYHYSHYFPSHNLSSLQICIPVTK